MPSATTRGFSGLATNPNPFSAVLDGAFVIGDEITCSAPNVITGRRGKLYSVPFTADRCFPFPTTSLLFCTSRSGANPQLYNPDTNTIFTLTRSNGNFPLRYPHLSDARVSVQAASANGGIYFTTQQGIQVAPGLSNAQWRTAGLPPAPLTYGIALLNSGFALTLASNMRRTYRVTIGVYDELGNFLEGPPSEPSFVENVSVNPQAPQLSFYPPLGTPANAFARVYRCPDTPLGVIGSDEMFLVVQRALPTTVGPPNNFASTSPLFIVDQSIDSLLAIPLYTNARTGDGQGGIAAMNTAPPAAGCIGAFKGRMYYGRVTQRHALQIQIIGTGTGGVSSGDVWTIDGVNYTAGTDFSVATVGGQVAQNCETTARNFVNALNIRYLTNVFPQFSLPIARQLRARYISVGNQDFGRILIERVFPASASDDTTQPFTFATTGVGVNFPNGIPSSTNNYIPGSLAWSKPNLPEAVPGINYTIVGDARSACLAFSAHRDVLLLWKEDGVWMIRDDGGPQPTISQLDASVNVIAPASVAVVDNASYAFTDRGLLRVTETATLPVGEPVRKDVLDALQLSLNSFAQAYGIGYDSERLYILGIPATPTEQGSSIQYVLRVPDSGYPPQLPKLTRWLNQGTQYGTIIPRSAGSKFGNRLAFVWQQPAPGFNLLNVPTSGAYIERKGGVVSTDFVDFIGSIANPATTTTNTLTFPQDVHYEMFPGDLFQYNPGGIGTTVYTMRILAVNGASVTLDNSYPFTAGGTFTYYRGIQSHWRHAAITLGEPTAEKQWSSGQLFFDYFDGDFLLGLLDSEKSNPRGFSIIPSDALASLQGGTVYTSTGLPGQSSLSGPSVPPLPVGQIQMLRNCKDVVLRVDPYQGESRAARMGAEFIFPCALASFRLTAASFAADEWKVKATR